MSGLKYIILLLLLIPVVYSQEGHMYLLAVKESGDDYTGSLADLYLEVRPGAGGVFMETFPLTKLDINIILSFAKEIVCFLCERIVLLFLCVLVVVDEIIDLRFNTVELLRDTDNISFVDCDVNLVHQV